MKVWNQSDSETSRPCVKADGQSARAVPAHKQTHGRTRGETSSEGGLSEAGRQNQVQHLNAAEASLHRCVSASPQAMARLSDSQRNRQCRWPPSSPFYITTARTQQTSEDWPWTRRCSPTISRACGILQMQTLPLVTVFTRGGQSAESCLKGGGAKSINDVLTRPNPPDLNSALWWCDSSSCRMLLVMLRQITIKMWKLLRLTCSDDRCTPTFSTASESSACTAGLDGAARKWKQSVQMSHVSSKIPAFTKPTEEDERRDETLMASKRTAAGSQS